ncbi:unnamed protein product [Caenorhabditis bovis]|uniref:E3 ubiquitin-protein ligase hrd-1 n=1 Tax=Caenorhabditis bovis TaxID=2654633 RepID=A0A8S1EC94_9PELO|nr:unnamed protein product [Caenorhabditis bovis]
MRISAGLMIGGSCVATAGTVLNAFLINKQFYPSIVYLTKSNASMAVLYFQGLVLVYLLFQLVRTIFFGDLRAAESEHLSERTWHAILETCLAFTVFRDDFSSVFVMQFVGLLFVKCFHWLADDRVDMMERSPVITLKFHLRMLSVLSFLGFLDSFLVSHAYFTTVNKGPSSQIVFGFEYAILLTMVIHVTTKYLIHMHDLRTAQSWENKAFYLLFAELLINLIRCCLYGAFAVIMLRVHTFPLFSVRPFYQSLRTLHKAFSDVILSRRAINAMNNQFPVVTAEELTAMDATCIICREEMTAESRPKRLPCSHVFHTHCLRSWFQRQQTCPTCRTDIWSRLGATAASVANNAAAGAPNAQAGDPNAQPAAQPHVFPFNGHQFAFAANFVQQVPQQGGAQGPFPHNIVYIAPPGNRPDNMPPPPPPPPGFPMFPGFMPPPPPFVMPTLPDYGGMTDEELTALEGTRREAVVARLRALDDIMTLIEAAQIQMAQLNSRAPPIPPRPEPAQPESNGASTDQPSVSSGTRAAPEIPTSSTSSAPSTSPVVVPTTAPSVSPTPSTAPTSSTELGAERSTTPTPKSLFRNSSSSSNTLGTTSSPTDSPSTSGILSNSRTPDAEELRQRRLARFERQSQNGGSPTPQ